MKTYLTKVLKSFAGIIGITYLSASMIWTFAIAITDNHWLWLYYVPIPFIIAGKDEIEKWFKNF